jgi:hypothetical protein
MTYEQQCAHLRSLITEAERICGEAPRYSGTERTSILEVWLLDRDLATELASDWMLEALANDLMFDVGRWEESWVVRLVASNCPQRRGEKVARKEEAA